MNVTVIRLALLLTLLMGILPPSVAAERIKCWTNKDGVRECGNVVPPEYSQRGHEELSTQGVVVDKQAPAKTPEELEEERRLGAIQAEEERKVKEQEIADQVLLDTFASEDDLILARDGKLAALEQVIDVTESRIQKLEKTLNEDLSMAAAMERSGKPPSEAIQKDIEEMRQQIAQNRAHIESLRNEQQAVRDVFEANLARFKELNAAGR
ncbi:MAG: hypothetical protein L0Y67_05930 [Gammaproteobacteria bacterium]|nr:hypothetical protein [Gammaproteobacteria bacterium]